MYLDFNWLNCGIKCPEYKKGRIYFKHFYQINVNNIIVMSLYIYIYCSLFIPINWIIFSKMIKYNLYAHKTSDSLWWEINDLFSVDQDCNLQFIQIRHITARAFFSVMKSNKQFQAINFLLWKSSSFVWLFCSPVKTLKSNNNNNKKNCTHSF